MRKIYAALLSLSILFIWNTKTTAQVSTYVFTQSNGTYTEITGGSVLGTTTSDDQYFVDPAVPAGGTTTTGVGFPIGFNFTYNGIVFDRFAVNNNGWISLGQSTLTPSVSLATTSAYTPLSSTATNTPALLRSRIAGIGRDIQAQAGAELRFETIGTAPNRKLVVQYKNYKRFGTAGTGDNLNFQIVLNETTDWVQVIYGTIVLNTTTTTSSINHVGLGGSVSTDFNNRQTTAPHNWNATIAGTTNAQGTQNATSTIAVTPPVSGLTFNWFVPPPCVAPPGGGTVTGPSGTICPGTSFNLNVTGASFGTGLTYQWESSPDNATWTNVTGATGVSLTTSVTTNTYFRRKITCSGTDGWSSSFQVTVTPPIATPFTETFATYATTFPPGCWTINNATYMGGFAPSAYGIGSGSARFQFFLASGGTQLDLSTPVFTAVPANYRVTFDHAYATYAGENDQLQILYSTDGGATYTALTTFNGGSAGPLNTAGTTTTQLTAPTAAQWASKAVNIPAGTNKLIFRGLSAFGNNLFLDNITVEPIPPCLPPSGLTISALTTTTATASWTASASNPSSGYQWEVRTSGAAGSGATGLTTSGTTAAGVTTTPVTGLTANTDYSLYVRANCGLGVFSSWTLAYNFHTPCDAIVAFPYTETFEAASITRPCWTTAQVSGTVNWTYGAGAGNGGNVTSAHGGTVNARHFGFGTGSVARLVSPAFNFSAMPAQGAQVTFWYANQNWLGDQNELRVYYKTSAAGAWTLVPGAVYATNVGVWTEVELMLPSSTGPTDYYIAFEGTELFGWGVAVDDVTIAAAPSCPKPTNVKAQAISPTSVAVSFTSPGAAFVVEYGAPGFVPGTTNVAGGGTVVLGAASPIIVTGLTASTAYDFYVRRICVPGVDYSANVKATATTLCPATNIPYTQTFESAVVPGMPTCTSSEDVNGSSGSFWNGDGAGSWETYTDANPLTYVSPSKSLLYFYDFNDLARPADDWFYTQGLNLTGGTTYRLKFFYKALDGVNYPEKMEVKYGTAAYSPNMTTGTLFTNNNISSVYANPFDSVQVDFTPPSTGVYYLGFHAMSDGDKFGILVDNINVKVAPLVDVGITNVTLPNLNCPTSGVFVQARIKNYNLTTLNLATNPVTVTANITGAATGTLTATLNTGTLAPNAVMDFYLSPAFNFTAGGVYNITVATSSPDDPETANNAYSTSVNVNPNPPTPVITPSAPAICSGSQVQLSTQFTTAPPPVTLPAVSSGAISVAVPDANAAGTTHTLAVSGVPAGATVTGVSVTINLTHTWISDMVINLRAPNGKILNLFNARGADGDNLTNTVISSASTTSLATATAPFTGTFAADAASGVGPTGFVSDVTSFAGLYSVGNGNWTLGLRDLFTFDLGTLTSWSITITYQMQNPVVTWSPVSGLYTNSTATTSYTAGTDAYSVYAKPAATTTYTVTATSSAGCVATANVTVTVNPTPVITIGSIPDTVCISDQVIPLIASPAGGSWSGIGVSGTNFIPPATAVGTYTLTYNYTSSAGCPASNTKKIVVKDCPERIVRLSDNALSLFPNPNNGLFNIKINSVLYNYLTMKVYTNAGVLVRTQQLSGLTWGRVVPIDLTNLPGGVYMVKFYYDGGVRTSEKTFKVIIGLP
ncbi:MAG: choice-of-anchor J domain-containing protein [Chitinophagaceae bacterium]|nr:choice-of-anchor J domain-containing protein [Chitinophagaceae bacterium]